jgi:Predicted dioxygenase
VLEAVWRDDETVVVVSTDLSQYLDYESARSRDGATTRAIELLAHSEIGDSDACGAPCLRALLAVARARGLGVTTLDVRSSGDLIGARDRVVGYGAYSLA